MNITPVQAVTPNISPYIQAISKPKEIDQTSFYRSAMVITVLEGVQRYLDYTAELKAQADYNEAHAAFSANVSIAAAERMRQHVNAKGEPTYETLASDVDKIAQDLGAAYLKKLAGPYAEKFKNDILSVRGQLAIKSYAETRKQQDEYVQSALETSLKEIMDAAVADSPENVEQHVSDYAQVIADAIGSGYMSEPTGKKLIEQAREEMFYNNFMKEAVLNAEALKPLILKSSARELGISQQHYNTLTTYINRRIHENEIDLHTRQNQMASDVHLSIAKTYQLENLITEDEIRKLEQAGEISPMQANDLDLQRFNREKSIADAIEKMRRSKSPNELENPLYSEEDKKIIYNAQLERRIAAAKEVKGGEPLTDAELFELNVDTTLSMPFACQEMAHLLKQGTKNATTATYADALVLAYSQLKAKCPNPTLGLLGVETSAILAMTSTMLGTHSDMSSINALNLARQTVANTANDPQLQMHNRSRLASRDVRKTLYGDAENVEKGIIKLVEDALDLTWRWYNPLSWTYNPLAIFYEGTTMSNLDLFELKQTLDNMYVLTGDAYAARRATADQLRTYWGVQPLAGEKIPMSYPPGNYIGHNLVPARYTRAGAEALARSKATKDELTALAREFPIAPPVRLKDLDKLVPIDIDYDFERFIEAHKVMMAPEDHDAEFSLQADKITAEMAQVAGSPITWQVMIKRGDQKRFSIYINPQGGTLRYPRYTDKGNLEVSK